jgi:Flp pilus assembly protein TadB
MKPKETPFTDAYVKEQQSKLSLGYKLFATLALLLLAAGLVVMVIGCCHLNDEITITALGIIFLVWASLTKQRMNTFQENLELSKMIQQLRQEK